MQLQIKDGMKPFSCSNWKYKHMREISPTANCKLINMHHLQKQNGALQVVIPPNRCNTWGWATWRCGCQPTPLWCHSIGHPLNSICGSPGLLTLSDVLSYIQQQLSLSPLVTWFHQMTNEKSISTIINRSKAVLMRLEFQKDSVGFPHSWCAQSRCLNTCRCIVEANKCSIQHQGMSTCQ